MPGDEWPSFLREFSAELVSEDRVREWLPAEVIETGWLGSPGAIGEELAALQSRLGVLLPPSYLNFLATSNGWLTTGWNSIRIWSTDEVGWLRDLDPSLIEIWTSIEYRPIPDEVYFVYGDTQQNTAVRAEYFRDMLAVSSRDWANQDQLWLNPRVTFSDGEWEAWHFSTEYPGASRHRSFRALMERELWTARFLRDA